MEIIVGAYSEAFWDLETAYKQGDISEKGYHNASRFAADNGFMLPLNSSDTGGLYSTSTT